LIKKFLWTTTEISKRELIRLLKTIDFSKEQMSSKEIEKIKKTNSHIWKYCQFRKKISSFNPLMDKYPQNFLLFPPLQYLIIVAPARQYIEPESMKEDSWMLTWHTNPCLFWREYKKFTFLITSKWLKNSRQTYKSISVHHFLRLGRWRWLQRVIKYWVERKTYRKSYRWIQSKCGW